MKAFGSAIVLASALMLATPANATLTDYVFSGSLADGTKFDGTFTLDDSGFQFQQFQNFYANVGGLSFTRLTSLGSGSNQFYAIGSYNGNRYFSIGLNARGDSSLRISGLKTGDLNQSNTYFLSNVFLYGSGTLSLANTAAVPEPATWALMILGFGVVGYSMRRRHKALVRFT